MLEEDDVVLKKGTVRVRALTRKEIQTCTGPKNGKDPSGIDVEVKVVTLGLIDPKLDIDEVRLWSGTESAGEFQKVASRIMKLSKMVDNEETEEDIKNAERAAYADFRGE